MSFTDQKPRIATKEDLTAPWSGYKDGSHFYCGLCGHLFKDGDVWRWICAGIAGLTNFMVCHNCDGEDVVDKWVELHEEWNELAKGKFRFIANRIVAYENELRHYGH